MYLVGKGGNVFGNFPPPIALRSICGSLQIFIQRSTEVKTVRVHNLVPRGDEVIGQCYQPVGEDAVTAYLVF